MGDNASDVGLLGIVGAGTMGAGIAIASAAHGVPVALVDTTAAAVAAARQAAEAFYRRQVERGRMDAAAAEAALARIGGGTELAALAEADLVIEAVFEDFDVKAALLRRLDAVVAPAALVATNTSCLTVGGLAEHLSGPERFLGMHYFNPAAISPIVEVVRGAQTGAAAMDRALAFCRETGKTPIACKDRHGFALNRFFCPYTNEAVRAFDEGLASMADIDRVATVALGAAAGPFRVMNLIKPRINLHAIRNLAPLGRFYAPADSMVRMGEADRDWEIGEPSAPDVARDSVIANRLRAGVFLAILEELDEAVAAPAEIDLGAAQAFKFGTPPCALMDRLGRSVVERLIAPLCARHGLTPPKSLARVGALVA